MDTQTISEEDTLTYLFEIRLEYKEGKEHVSDEGKVGEYLGSGEGTVQGRINGTVHWSLFEAQNPVFCASNLFGVIFTDDGAEIKFDTMGFFRRPAKGSHIWQNTSGIFLKQKMNVTNGLLKLWEYGKVNLIWNLISIDTRFMEMICSVQYQKAISL